MGLKGETAPVGWNMARRAALWGHQAGSWLAWQQQLLRWAVLVCTDGASLLPEPGAKDTSLQAEKQGWNRGHTLLHMIACSRLCACVPASPSTPGTAQGPSLLLDPSVPPCPRAFAFACHLCGHRQCWAGDQVCWSNSTVFFFFKFYFFKDMLCNLALFPLLFLSPPSPSLPALDTDWLRNSHFLMGRKRGKTDLD